MAASATLKFAPCRLPGNWRPAPVGRRFFSRNAEQDYDPGGPPNPAKSVTLTAGIATVERTSEDTQLLYTAIEAVICFEQEDGDLAREMRRVGKSLHELLERLSVLVQE